MMVNLTKPMIFLQCYNPEHFHPVLAHDSTKMVKILILTFPSLIDIKKNREIKELNSYYR